MLFSCWWVKLDECWPSCGNFLLVLQCKKRDICGRKNGSSSRHLLLGKTPRAAFSLVADGSWSACKMENISGEFRSLYPLCFEELSLYFCMYIGVKGYLGVKIPLFPCLFRFQLKQSQIPVILLPPLWSSCLQSSLLELRLLYPMLTKTNQFQIQKPLMIYSLPCCSWNSW